MINHLRFFAGFSACLLVLHFLLFLNSCNFAGYTIQTVSLNEDHVNPIYKIEASLPKLTGHNDSFVQQKINEAVAYYIQSQILQFKEDIKISQSNPERKDKTGKAGELNIETLIGLKQKNLVSIKVTTFYRNSEAAYPEYLEHGFTFDARNGELLTLDRIFHSESDYLNKLSEYIKPRIAEQKKASGFPVDSLMLAEATLPNSKNFNNFLIYQDRIIFFFPYYLISTQKQQDVWIDIPYKEIKPLILKQYRW